MSHLANESDFLPYKENLSPENTLSQDSSLYIKLGKYYNTNVANTKPNTVLTAAENVILNNSHERQRNRSFRQNKDDSFTATSENIAKKFTDLESELIKEKAYANILKEEKNNLEYRLQDTLQNFNQGNQFCVQQQEIERLEDCCKEKDNVIQNLMEDVINKSRQHESQEEDGQDFRNTLANFKNDISELESKLAMLVTENERLNQNIEDKNEQIQKNEQHVNKLLEDQNTDEKLKNYYTDKSKDWEQNLNKLVIENEKIVLINQNLQKKYDAVTLTYQNLDKRHEQQIEEVKKQWKAYYEKESRNSFEKYEVENELLTSQLKHSQILNNDLQSKINMYMKEVDDFKREKLDYQYLDDIQPSNENIQEYQKRISQQENKIGELMNQSQQYHQMNELNLREIDKLKFQYEHIVQENEKYTVELKQAFESNQNIAIEKEKGTYEQRMMQKDRQYTEIQEKMMLLTNDLEKTSEMLNERTKQLELAQNDVNQLECLQQEQKSIIEDELNVVKYSRSQLENKIQLLLEDNSKLNQALRSRVEEIEILRTTAELHENTIKTVIIENQSALKVKVNELDQQKQQLQIVTKQFDEADYSKSSQQNQLKNFQLQVQDLEKLQQVLIKEKDQISENYNKKVKESDNFASMIQQTLKEKEASYNQKLKELEKFKIQNQEFSKKIDSNYDNFSGQLLEKQREMEKYRIDYQSILSESQEIKKRSQETEQLLQSKQEHYEHLQERYNQLMIENDNLSAYRSDADKLRIENQNLNFKHQNQLKVMETQFEMSTKEIVNQELHEQKCHYDNELSELQNERISLESKIQNTMSETTRMDHQYVQQIQDLQQRIHQQEKQGKLELNDVTERIVCEFTQRLQEQQEDLEKIVQQQNNECEGMKKNVDQTNKNNNALKQDNEKLIKEVDILYSKQQHIDPNHPVLLGLNKKIEQLKRENMEYHKQLYGKLEAEQAKKTEQYKAYENEKRHKSQQLEKDIFNPISHSKPAYYQRSPISARNEKTITSTFEQSYRSGFQTSRQSDKNSILESNNKMNKMILERCRNIVKNAV